MKYSNLQNVPLPLAVWLAHEEYDFVGGKDRISATSLLRSTRQFVLAQRVPMVERDLDVMDFFASRRGHAFHDSIERAWEQGYDKALKNLGYPQAMIDRVRINVEPGLIQPGDIPVYLERRGERQIDGFTVSGKFDMAIEGELFDTKSTSVYSWIKGSKDEDYIRQGSIYRWIHRDVLNGSQIHIQHIFTDWTSAQAKQAALAGKRYPKQMENYTLDLLSLEDTEALIRSKIADIKRYIGAPEEAIPHCTDKELWRNEPTYKYYADPAKTSGRATKNFDNLIEANKFRAEKGKGVVLTVPGTAKACGYCPGFKACKQKDLVYAG